VEDPLLLHVENLCEDPRVVRDEILRFVCISSSCQHDITYRNNIFYTYS
jgi:hypothetical protein